MYTFLSFCLSLSGLPSFSPPCIHVSFLSLSFLHLSLSLSSLLQLIEESKAMKQLGVSLSSPAQLLLGQEGRIKQFNQHLQYSVTNLTATIDMIDDKLNPLFHDTIDTVLRWVDMYIYLLEGHFVMHVYTIYTVYTV